jgi:hypothetical protein
MSPTVWSYAINMGLIQNGKPVESAIRAFQKKNGLEVDGIIGNDTSNAIISAATPGMPNIGRGNQGGAAVGNNATPAAAGTGGPPAGSGTIMPGVKDSKGRQVYKRPDSSVMAWDPTTQLFSFYDAPSVYRGSESGKNYAQSGAKQPAAASATPVAATTKAAPAATAPARPDLSLDRPMTDILFKSKAQRDAAWKDNYNAWETADAAWYAKYGKTHNNDGTPKTVQTTVVKESSDLARIRHLAGLTRN